MKKTFYDSIIEEMYDAEAAMQVEDLEIVRFSVSADVENLSLIDAVALRFKRSRADIFRDITRAAAQSMFISLTPEDRKVVGERADELIDKHMEANTTEYKRSGSIWAGYAEIANKTDSENADS